MFCGMHLSHNEKPKSVSDIYVWLKTMPANRTLFSMSSWRCIGCLLWLVIFSWISVKWTDWENRDSGSLWIKCRTHSIRPLSPIIQQHVHADNYQTRFNHPDEMWSQGNEHKRAGTRLLAGPQLIRPLVPDGEIACLLAAATCTESEKFGMEPPLASLSLNLLRLYFWSWAWMLSSTVQGMLDQTSWR